MANTLKFGNGQWATKVGSTLAYNDENGNFKPLPFNFTRSTSGTRVNKDGLIEVVTNNKPRIDFLNDSDGALLLEPTRSNINTFSDPTDAQKGSLSYASVTYQDDFNWGLGNVIENAIVFGDNSTTRYAYYSSAVSSGASYSLSFFIKMDDNSVPIPATDFLLVLAGTSIASGYTIDNYGNNVYRISVSGTAGASNTANGILKVASHSAKTFKITGFQIEAGSYPTSYIPTQGAISTRVAETCNQTPPSGIIGQTEGTIFFNADVTNTFGVQLGNSSGGVDYVNSIQIAFGSVSTNVNVFNGGAAQFSYSGVVNTGVKKVALTYKQNDFAFYIDGNQIITDNLGTIPSISGIFFNHQNLGTTGGLLTDLKIYNTRLSNSELQALTSN